jgi:multisubunit Na+/H+ antiporter MnhE subunit
MSRFLLSLALLTATYLLVLVSLNPWDVAVGLLLSVSLLLALRRLVFGEQIQPIAHLGRRLLALPRFVLAVLWDILQGTWTVLLITLHLRPLRQPGLVALPIGERTPLGVAVSVLALTLSPGAYLVDIDEAAGVILIHAIDASDPAAIRAKHQAFYERYQRPVFP